MKSLLHKFSLFALLLLAALPARAQTLAVDPATYSPAWPANKWQVPFIFNKDTGALIVQGGGGGGGGGGSTTFSNPQSIRLSTGSAWQDFRFGAGNVDGSTLRVTLAADGPAVTALTSIEAKTPALVGGRQPVDGSGVTQPVTGTVTANLGTLNGAATETTLAAINGKIPAQGTAAPSGAMPVNLSNGLSLTGAAYTSTNGLVNVDIITGTTNGWYDAQAFVGRYVSFTLISGASTAGTVNYEFTNDPTLDPSGGVWNLQDATQPTQVQSTSQTLASSVFYRRHGVIPGRYIRVRISTAISAGSVQGVFLLSQTPFAPITQAVAQATAGSLNFQAVGASAEDAVAAGNPVSVGGIVRTALPAASIVAGDSIRATLSQSGQIITKPYAVRDLDFQVPTTITTATQTLIRAAQAAGIRQNITGIVYQNTSATATTVTIQDGSTTLYQFSAPASMANPVPIPFPQPLFGTAATALNYTAGTTGANVLFLVTGFNSY